MAVIVAVVTACFFPAAAAAQDVTVHAVVDSFHAALERGDSIAMISYLDPDVKIYESGHAETLDEYRSGHLASDIEFAQATESRLLSSWVSFTMGSDAVESVTTGRVYRTVGTFRGRAIDTFMTETMVLHRGSDGVLRIHHIHWSSRRATPSDPPFPPPR
jgi:hypothetical protein